MKAQLSLPFMGSFSPQEVREAEVVQAEVTKVIFSGQAKVDISYIFSVNASEYNKKKQKRQKNIRFFMCNIRKVSFLNNAPERERRSHEQ